MLMFDKPCNLQHSILQIHSIFDLYWKEEEHFKGLYVYVGINHPSKTLLKLAVSKSTICVERKYPTNRYLPIATTKGKITTWWCADVSIYAVKVTKFTYFVYVLVEIIPLFPLTSVGLMGLLHNRLTHLLVRCLVKHIPRSKQYITVCVHLHLLQTL